MELVTSYQCYDKKVGSSYFLKYKNNFWVETTEKLDDFYDIFSILGKFYWGL